MPSQYQEREDREAALRRENEQLREEIEQFNRTLIERELELEQLQEQIEELFALLHQIHREERRSPALHARPLTRKHLLEQPAAPPEHLLSEPGVRAPAQEILPLNIWLVSRDRLIEQIMNHYASKRDRLLIIEHYEFVRQLVEIGNIPDIIITGTYDFGLDDPFQRSFSEVLEQLVHKFYKEFGAHTCFVITLSSSMAVQTDLTEASQSRHIRQRYISKLRGLQVTISELRFFLELRRCQQDIMEAEIHREIQSMQEAFREIVEIQRQQKTGLLEVFSDESPTDVRWVFQLFYLHGKLVKTDHTLESAVALIEEGAEAPLEKIFTLSSIDSKYQVNAPRQLVFFPLYEQTVRREMKDIPLMS